jgi:hypothetical protein
LTRELVRIRLPRLDRTLSSLDFSIDRPLGHRLKATMLLVAPLVLALLASPFATKVVVADGRASPLPSAAARLQRAATRDLKGRGGRWEGQLQDAHDVEVPGGKDDDEAGGADPDDYPRLSGPVQDAAGLSLSLGLPHGVD